MLIDGKFIESFFPNRLFSIKHACDWSDRDDVHKPYDPNRILFVTILTSSSILGSSAFIFGSIEYSFYMPSIKFV